MLNIGVIDSGIGGLTVLFDVIKSYPNCNYFYIGDNKNCPYGEKSATQIKNLSLRLVKYLVDEKKIDILIIACNSISSTSTSYLKKQFKNIKIIETVEPTASYVKQIGFNKALVIATKATVDSKMYVNSLEGHTVYQKACPKFVEIVEDINITNKLKDEIVKDELDEYLNKVDTIILGCTHFPLLIKSIEKIFKGKIIKSSEGIILKLSDLIPTTNQKGLLKIYTTGNNVLFENKLKKMFGKTVKTENIDL